MLKFKFAPLTGQDAQTWIWLLFACRILRFFIVGNFKFIEDSASLNLDVPKKFILDSSDLQQEVIEKTLITSMKNVPTGSCSMMKEG